MSKNTQKKKLFMRSLTVTVLIFGACSCLWGCNALSNIEHEINGNSENAPVENAVSRPSKPAVASKVPQSNKALEQNKNETKQQESSVTEGNFSEKPESSPATLPPKEKSQAELDEEQALKNTEVTGEIGTGMLPPVDAETAEDIKALPTYATVSGRQTCSAALGSAANTVASELTAELLKKLSVDHGKIYCAPTVISDEYQDCVDDVSSYIKKAAAESGNFEPVSSEVKVAQNEGSSTLIPRTVRECRRLDIPYVAVSVVRKSGGVPVLTVRIIRVQTGVTLTQSYRKLN